MWGRQMTTHFRLFTSLYLYKRQTEFLELSGLFIYNIES